MEKTIQNRIKFFNAYLKQCNAKEGFLKNFKEQLSVNWRRKHGINVLMDRFLKEHFEDWSDFLNIFTDAFPWQQSMEGNEFWIKVNGNWYNKCQFECEKFKLLEYEKNNV